MMFALKTKDNNKEMEWEGALIGKKNLGTYSQILFACRISVAVVVYRFCTSVVSRHQVLISPAQRS
uniref:Uncharacterized protein n=1 Tax=Rhizophora mucronata TaxID=61149 RepID=A0A2P2P632_RHIMU